MFDDLNDDFADLHAEEEDATGQDEYRLRSDPPELYEGIDGFAAQIANGTTMSLSEAIRLGLLNEDDIPQDGDPDDYEVECRSAIIGVDWAKGEDHTAGVQLDTEDNTITGYLSRKRDQDIQDAGGDQ